MPQLNPDEWRVLAKVLSSYPVKNLIGAEEWDLTEDEEDVLYRIIEKVSQHT